jgi:holo-[acyl-carrier protein] synthase
LAVVGLGVDAVELDRFATALARTPRLVTRVFTEAERAYCDRGRGATRVERYAARFAAKEAVMKMLGVGLGAFRFHDVEVVRASSGEPSLQLRGRAAELAAARGATSWLLSITHTERTSFVVVVAQDG